MTRIGATVKAYKKNIEVIRNRNKMDRHWSKEKEQKDFKPLHKNRLETANQSCI
jgi:Sec-independent protein translocase protein TatA